MREVTLSEMEDMQYSSGYADYIMANGDGSVRAICNGDTLTMAMEDGYLFEEYAASIGVTLP
jgi:hypothetical protein